MQGSQASAAGVPAGGRWLKGTGVLGRADTEPRLWGIPESKEAAGQTGCKMLKRRKEKERARGREKAERPGRGGRAPLTNPLRSPGPAAGGTLYTPRHA